MTASLREQDRPSPTQRTRASDVNKAGPTYLTDYPEGRSLHEVATALFSFTTAFAHSPASVVAPKAVAVTAASPATASKDAPAVKVEKKVFEKPVKPFVAKIAK